MEFFTFAAITVHAVKLSEKTEYMDCVSTPSSCTSLYAQRLPAS